MALSLVKSFSVLRAWLRVLANAFRDDAHSEDSILIILGGDRDREIAAARSVESLPRCRLLILSSGAATESDLTKALASVGRRDVRVCADRRAIDTVSNCTTLAPELASCTATTSVTLCTARAHCRRARAIGALIFGACGIRVHMRPVDTAERLNESLLRCVRDVVRACCWVTTGFDLSSVAALVHARRAADSDEWRAREGEASIRRLRHALADSSPMR